uniref:Uncharacterized protein n=1 Tax=Siphoviridae sp. ctEw721 TaxID=2825400 RepID=A0A8S5TS25_9CAUD|nr:MAG TPA: hypothetical protein [Siphoviridae sp. ctEw721]
MIVKNIWIGKSAAKPRTEEGSTNMFHECG